MPGWFNFKRRVFHKAEFRFAVKYDTPVFIVCSVANENFPITDQTALFIGDNRPSPEKSDKKVDVRYTVKGVEVVDLIPTVEEPKKQTPVEQPQGVELVRTAQSQKRVHTVNNERATWITLLFALHTMETESRRWENEQVGEHTPSRDWPPVFQSHKLAVAIQRKTRSWDNMPSSITKPYATTTICHIMEMAAMLGLHWREFDRAKDTFLAEGNGYVLKSTSISELGTVFTFQTRGSSVFEGNRTIPAEEVKDLAFGLVPTIYHKDDDLDRSRLTALSADEFRDLKYLQMGSANELSETLTSLGCSTEVSGLIRRNDTNQRHLYPIAFEVLGMLGKSLHVKNSFFRTLPNPTFYQWDVRYFNLSEALRAYSHRLNTSTLLQAFNENLVPFRLTVGDVKTALDKLEKDGQSKSVKAQYLGSLHAALEICDEYLKKRQSDAKRILSEHVQFVLLSLNPEHNKDREKHKVIVDAFTKLNSAQPGAKEKQLISLYFEHVLPHVRGEYADANEHGLWLLTVPWYGVTPHPVTSLSPYTFEATATATTTLVESTTDASVAEWRYPKGSYHRRDTSETNGKNEDDGMFTIEFDYFRAACRDSADRCDRKLRSGSVNYKDAIVTTVTGTMTEIAVAVPTNVAPNTITNFVDIGAKYYTVSAGDTCASILIAVGLPLADFYFLNPIIDSTCSNLWLGTAYCVRPVGSIFTYYLVE
ncbi:hypothetical protein G7054_g7329 [Neopestalotiopsis clavispora]|nr:hypothetical protein G7054_g7329 [Neopestalotiopsis clavispora]